MRVVIVSMLCLCSDCKFFLLVGILSMMWLFVSVVLVVFLECVVRFSRVVIWVLDGFVGSRRVVCE